MKNTHNKHYPAEIFGYPAENKSKKADDFVNILFKKLKLNLGIKV
jgi:hypothetical protein